MRKGKEELGISGRNDEKRISQEKYQEKYKRQERIRPLINIF